MLSHSIFVSRFDRSGYWRHTRLLASIILMAASAAWAQDVPRDSKVQATTRMVLGIISYARWPTQPDSYRVCTKGGELLENPASIGDRPVIVQALVGNVSQSMPGCNVLYLGNVPASLRKQLLADVQGRSILTISEGDEDCVSGSMFCLGLQADNVILQANLDAISRSGIRINPAVLKLTRRKSVQP